MPRALIALALFLSLGLPAWSSPRDELRTAIGTLREVSGAMGENDEELAALLTKLETANTQVASSEDQIKALTALLETHTARVKQLGDRYTKVLELAQKLKKDLEWSATLNYVLGGTTAAAVIVAVVVGLAR